MAAEELKRVERELLKEAYGELHPAGGMNDQFVYEPIGFGKYVYRTIGGAKGIAELGVEYEDEKNKRRPHWLINVEGQPCCFREKPESSWLFKVPKRKTAKDWVAGKRKSKTLHELWLPTQIYFKTFLDLPKEYEYPILALGVVQSWLSDLLKVVFYIGVQAEWGGGKTVSGEAVIIPCRHGYQTGNLSPAFVARSLEKEKITLFVDELDSVAGTKDSQLYQIFRQGYRRGGTYSRVNKDTMKRETYQVFGPKIFTVHSSVEPALQTRTIPLHSRETGDHRFPIINVDKDFFGFQLMEEWFLWYLDNIFEIKETNLEALSFDQFDTFDLFRGDKVDQFTAGSSAGRLPSLENMDSRAEKLREFLYERKASLLTKGQISQISGRNVELAYQMYVLSNLLNVNMDNDIVETFTQKSMEESEQREIGLMGALKDVLTQIWLEKRKDKDFLTESGQVKVSNKELYSKYNKILKDEGYTGISPHKFKEYLSEFGFTDALNRKKMSVLISEEGKPKVRLCNIFTPRVLRKLEIEKEEKGTENAISPILSVGDKIKIVYEKARELAIEGLVSKFAVAEALEDSMDCMEVLRILVKLVEEGRLAEKDAEHYVVA